MRRGGSGCRGRRLRTPHWPRPAPAWKPGWYRSTDLPLPLRGWAG